MNSGQFIEAAKITDKQEVEKSCFLAFFFHETIQLEEFSVDDVCRWFSDARLGVPNKSRLRLNLGRSGNTFRGSSTDKFKLRHEFIQDCRKEFPHLHESDEITDSGTVLPKDLYANTRGYVQRLGSQINASYEGSIFDGCAVLMRRLLEILLILAYEELLIAQAIKDSSGTYKMLEAIIDNAKGNSQLNLSRNGRESVDHFRKLGNFSAHKIHYNCRREDIKHVMLEYRALIEELLYKSGLKK